MMTMGKHDLRVSRHGDKRARQRAGLPRKAVERMAGVALSKGIGYGEAYGSLKGYLGWLYARYDGSGNNIRIYGDKVWVFHDGTLITMLNVPGEQRKAARDQQRKRRSKDW